MSAIGFVYILRNEYMPDLYKVGCTERSPHERAEELSKGTAVPAPFKVVCYIEVPNFQMVEKDIHEWAKHHRVNSGREFFEHCLLWLLQLMWHHRKRLAFTLVDKEYVDTLITDHDVWVLEDLPDPWAPEKSAEPEAQAAPQAPEGPEPPQAPDADHRAAEPLRLVGNADYDL